MFQARDGVAYAKMLQAVKIIELVFVLSTLEDR